MPSEWIEAFLPEQKKIDNLVIPQDAEDKKGQEVINAIEKDNNPFMKPAARFTTQCLKSIRETPKESVLENILEIKQSLSPITASENTSPTWQYKLYTINRQ